ncbi:Spo0E family sporulation regulatory protein-aspartic acid phosphatase [Brevibacillus sp. 7WMA2]|uniref:aspartyl-phosphate phosphatase Spo0E family protein n=1 Tax=Brevibacillus TaxID=55080 RepID=UPI000BD4D42E|nr:MULTISPECIES: aspartyl-phosphate phosphatase Spo0E family protein [Brevibacillus]PCN43815.1 sporulation protein Spo0E [Brevibacillus laterosporus]QIC04469.1 Spo0E family sporulation regulatory protein-aspartic acid phosphatase [Brevibacillus sp. 7WMA2]WPS89607.1 aspartyl-phosphate phosphatase Spo0E family protein [Brevibacillus halotolerans]
MQNSQLEQDLQKHFDLLRQGLEMLYYKEGSFLHPEVLQMTQQLDEYIVAFQKTIINFKKSIFARLKR